MTATDGLDAANDPVDDIYDRIKLVGRAFTPSTPITDRVLFAGRQEQMQTLILVEAQAGQHAVMYGVRGAGKTSLARVAQLIIDPMIRPYHVCHSGDTFATIWRALLNVISLTNASNGLGFNATQTVSQTTAASLLPAEDENVTVQSVIDALARLEAMNARLTFVIDEFDRPRDPSVRTQIADTVKILADRSMPITLILVGVADSIAELIGEHESIQRSIVQVEMPPMTDEELKDVVTRGMQAAKLTAEKQFIDEVIGLSQGLPHYTHLLCLHAATNAVRQYRDTVTHNDLAYALHQALEAASQTVRERYHQSTFSNRDTLYKVVLLACAMCPRDELGSFGGPDVRDQLRKITNTNYEISSFATHLRDFSSDGPRGGILKRIGIKRRFRYRFIDPLMPTYVLMQGLTNGGSTSSKGDTN
jgi:Cdc6-like AAA superfamily ATPase